MTDTTAGEGVKALLDHMKLMQRTATAYLVPEDYRDRNGNVIFQGTEHNSPGYKSEQRGRRAEAFVNDMLYLLDGPEQRAAEAKALAAQPSAGAQPVRDLVFMSDTVEYEHPDFGRGHFFTSDCIRRATPSQPDTGDVAALREALIASQGLRSLQVELNEAYQFDEDEHAQELLTEIAEAEAKIKNALAALSKPNAPGAG